MIALADKKMPARVIGSDGVVSLAASVFLQRSGPTDQREFAVQFPDGEKVLKVRVFSIRKRYGSVMNFVVGGQVLECDGESWESFAAYFEMTANYHLHGSCVVKDFPEDILP